MYGTKEIQKASRRDVCSVGPAKKQPTNTFSEKSLCNLFSRLSVYIYIHLCIQFLELHCFYTTACYDQHIAMILLTTSVKTNAGYLYVCPSCGDVLVPQMEPFVARWVTRVKPSRCDHFRQVGVSNGCFLKWWYPTTMGWFSY